MATGRYNFLYNNDILVGVIANYQITVFYIVSFPVNCLLDIIYFCDVILDNFLQSIIIDISQHATNIMDNLLIFLVYYPKFCEKW